MGTGSDGLFKSILEATSGGVLIADLETRHFFFANPGMCRMLGYSEAELVTLGVEHIHPPADLPRVVEVFEAQARGELDIGRDIPLLRKDGTVLWADITTTAAVIDGVPANVGFFIDVTERHRAEEALRHRERELNEANQLLEAVIDAIPDVLGVQDADHTILRYNRAGYELLGVGPEEVVGKKCFQALHRVVPCEECASQRVYDTQVPAQLERYVPEMDRWLDCRAYPVLDEEGRIFRVVEHLRDITERRQLEGQLRQSEKLQAIGQLAGGVAHDFNNQLGGILGLAELLRSELADRPDLAQLADGILGAVDRAATLTAQLLAFARRGKYLSVPVDLHELVVEVCTLLARSVDKRIRLVRRLEAPGAAVLGDPSQLQNALLNLALNARDAMPEGGELRFETCVVSLDAEFCESHPYEIVPGEYVQLSVTDDGVGMDAETQRRMFEPFFTTKEKGKGTGMGLAAVYGTVKSHRGAIGVYSEPGRGTTIRVYLPAWRDKVRREEPCDRRLQAASGPAQILLVDDEEIILTAARAMLERLGYRVLTCGSGRDALALYQERHAEIDLVILDMVMPELAGRETFEAMLKVNPKIRALLASGYSLNGEAQAILDRGVRSFLQKPFRLAELARTVAEALKDPAG